MLKQARLRGSIVQARWSTRRDGGERLPAPGVAAAARVFFDTTPGRLKLKQAALLAGLPQAPSSYNPFANPRAAKQRRNEVLRAMVKAGHLSAARAQRVEGYSLGVHHN